MDRYASINGKTTATAATIDVGIAGLWNPSTSKRISLREAHIVKQGVGAADEPALRRITTRGTATGLSSTIVNDQDNSLAPLSGAALDMNYTVQPTISAGTLHAWVLPAAIGAGIMWSFPQGIEIPPGNGICIMTGIALAFPVSRVTFVWAE